MKSNLNYEMKLLGELAEKYGLGHIKVLAQSTKVDKLILEVTKKINNIK